MSAQARGGRAFGLGHIPAPGHRFTPIRHALARLGLATPPVSLDYTPILPDVFDQGPTESCEGHAASAAIVGVFAKARTPLPFIPSMSELYKLARMIDRAPRRDGSLPELTDDGAEGNAVIRAFEEFGIRPMGPVAFDGRYSDADPLTINDEPGLWDLELDRRFRLAGAYSILDATAQDVGDAYMQALNAFGPIPTACFADSALMDWVPSLPPVGIPNHHDRAGGWHKVLVVGYDHASGDRRWKVRNSWGYGWGQGGHFYATDLWLADSDEREVYSPRRSP